MALHATEFRASADGETDVAEVSAPTGDAANVGAQGEAKSEGSDIVAPHMVPIDACRSLPNPTWSAFSNDLWQRVVSFQLLHPYLTQQSMYEKVEVLVADSTEPIVWQ
eukprot:4563838-Lingulodinium_polyedra.AAC.1